MTATKDQPQTEQLAQAVQQESDEIRNRICTSHSHSRTNVGATALFLSPCFPRGRCMGCLPEPQESWLYHSIHFAGSSPGLTPYTREGAGLSSTRACLTPAKRAPCLCWTLQTSRPETGDQVGKASSRPRCCGAGLPGIGLRCCVPCPRRDGPSRRTDARS